MKNEGREIISRYKAAKNALLSEWEAALTKFIKDNNLNGEIMRLKDNKQGKLIVKKTEDSVCVWFQFKKRPSVISLVRFDTPIENQFMPIEEMKNI